MSDPEKRRDIGSSPRKASSENVSVELQKLRVSRIRRVSDPGTSEAGPDPVQGDDDLLSRSLGRLHVAPAAGRAACPCGRRCRSPGALAGCRRRRLVLRPARLKPARRPLLREARLLRPVVAAAAAAAASSGAAAAVRAGTGAAAGVVFGGTAPDRCSEFAQLTAAASPAAASSFVDAGAPVFAAFAAATAAEPAVSSPPTTACSLQHRQRRPASVDELAGLVAQVSIMSSMAEMMYT